MTNQPSGVKLPTSETLLPCPFCGSEPQLMEGHRNHWRVECPKCGVRRAQFANGGVEEDKARAVRSWNKRQPTSPALPTDAQVKAGAARRAAQRARRYGEEAVAGDVTLVDEEEAREIYLAMQAEAPATSVGGVGLREADTVSRQISDGDPGRASSRADEIERAMEREGFRLLRRRTVRDASGPWVVAMDFRKPALSQSSSPVSSNEPLLVPQLRCFLCEDRAHQCETCAEQQRIANTLEASSPIVGSGVLDWLAQNVNLELQWSEVDGDLSECAWHVFKRSGGINDREWSEVARGETPFEALTNARAVLAALSIREDVLDSGADRALVASDQARSGLGPSGFDHG